MGKQWKLGTSALAQNTFLGYGKTASLDKITSTVTLSYKLKVTASGSLRGITGAASVQFTAPQFVLSQAAGALKKITGSASLQERFNLTHSRSLPGLTGSSTVRVGVKFAGSGSLQKITGAAAIQERFAFTHNKSLAAITGAAQLQEKFNLTHAKSLGGITGSSQVQVGVKFTGSGALQRITGSSSLKVGNVITHSKALPGITGSSQVKVGNTFTSSGSFAKITGSSTFAVGVSFTHNKALAAITGAASLQEKFNLTHSKGLAAIAGGASLQEKFNLTASGSLRAITGAAQVAQKFSLVGNSSLPGVTGSSQVKVGAKFSHAGTLAAVTGSSAWAEGWNLSAAGTLRSLTGSATVNHQTVYIVNGNSSLPAVTGEAGLFSDVPVFTIAASGTLQGITGRLRLSSPEIAFDVRPLFPQVYTLVDEDGSFEAFCRTLNVHFSRIYADSRALTEALTCYPGLHDIPLSDTALAVLRREVEDLGNPFCFVEDPTRLEELHAWLVHLYHLRGSIVGLKQAILWLLRIDAQVELYTRTWKLGHYPLGQTTYLSNTTVGKTVVITVPSPLSPEQLHLLNGITSFMIPYFLLSRVEVAP